MGVLSARAKDCSAAIEDEQHSTDRGPQVFLVHWFPLTQVLPPCVVQDENQSEHHELLSANVRSKVRLLGTFAACQHSCGPCLKPQESLVQEFSVRLATALGVTDIISLCVLALVFLLALYFVWGGSWNKPPCRSMQGFVVYSSRVWVKNISTNG